MLFIATLVLGGVTVTLPMEARVRGTEVNLGTIADVRGADQELVERVRSIDLGYAPAPGFSRLLQESWLRQRVERIIPGVELEFLGQPATRVWPLVERIAPDRIRQAAEEEIKRLLQGEEGTFQAASPILEALVPAGVENAVLRANLATDTLASGAVNVPVQVLVDGAPYRTIWTSFEVRVWHTVPVLRRHVRSGERLTDEMFERRSVLRRDAGRGQALPLDAVFGSTAARDLAPGAVVTAADVHRPIAIEQGRSVILQVRKGAIVARIPGLARDNGSIGDRVRVVLLDTQAELIGTVRSRDLVEITLQS
jgi:flagella basal body P-ring formation protein FlgA